ncbi:MAG: threonine--tRNA ligase [Patescibacteria group bacterium]|nr:threonine--tRNA ligase [Patescibacteria group bacterium]
MPQKDDQLTKIRHSLSHLMSMAVQELYPKVGLGVGPTIEDGFYQDYDLPETLAPAILPKLEKRMRQMIGKNIKFEQHDMDFAEALKLYKHDPYKTELIKDLKAAGEKKVSFYRSDWFDNLCAGPHVNSTKEIDPDAFKLTQIAGAYWRGDEKNKMLTRIYGVAFANKPALDEYLVKLEEAKKRDHKILGPKLDLFTFSDLVGAGLPLFTPKGTLIRDLLDSLVWKLRQARGYERVDIPHITKKDLYERSGHWSKFSNELFRINTREGHVFAMKPMNCPHHIQIYARKQWSFRELPQRYASTTKVYRDEQTGELSGLARVRSITQDDAHVFCRLNQAEEELNKIWDIVHEFYAACKLPLKLRLSLHDPEHQEKYLGDKAHWKEAEKILFKIANAHKTEFWEAPGEAAFYGPKLDFMATDSLSREWQVATIQLDVNMPRQFDLTCVAENGKPEPIVMIHAAIMGAIERFLAVIIEHFGGAFPLWLAPVQVSVIPVSDKFTVYAEKLAEELRSNDLRVEVDERNESVGKKIREAEMQKAPYMLVVGEKEQALGNLTVRKRGEKDQTGEKLEAFTKRLEKEIKEKR